MGDYIVFLPNQHLVVKGDAAYQEAILEGRLRDTVKVKYVSEVEGDSLS